jgi:uncharacterized OB-fold protein
MTGEGPAEDPSDVFFDGCRRGELLLKHCPSCGVWSFPGVLLAPALRPRCPECFAADPKWVPSSGRGSLYTFTTMHRAPEPGRQVPYSVCLVELDEGPRIFSNVVNCDSRDLIIGMRLRVKFEVTEGRFVRPVFEPDDPT